MAAEFKLCQKVHYIGNSSRSGIDNGIIKRFCEDGIHVFVTYNFPTCEGCPKNGQTCTCQDYLHYTAARTRIKDLREGWLDGEGRCDLHRDLVDLKPFGLMEDLK